MPVVDSINGILIEDQNSPGFTIGTIYRVTLLIACMFLFIDSRADRRLLIMSAAMIITIVVPHLYDAVANGYLSTLIKILLPVIVGETFRVISTDENEIYSKLRKIVSSWIITFPICYLIPFILHTGYYTYESELIGYKAFFDAQNSLGCVMICLYVFAFNDLLSEFTIGNCAKVVLIATSVLLIGLKSLYILIILITLILLFRSGKLLEIKKIAITIFLLGILMLIITIFTSEIEAIIARWSYFFKNTDGFIDFFTSGRAERIAPTLRAISEDNPLWWVFGISNNYQHVVMSAFNYENIEMDLIDLLLQVGVIGVSLIIYYYSSVVDHAVKCNFCSAPEVLSLLIAFCMGLLAGHVFFTGICGMLLSVLCGMITSVEKDNHIASME